MHRILLKAGFFADIGQFRISRCFRAGLTGALCLCPSLPALAQETPEQPAENPPSKQPAETLPSEPEAPKAQSPTYRPGLSDQNLAESVLRFGPVVLRPGTGYSIAYSDNIFGGRAVAPGTQKSDVIHRFLLDLSASLWDFNDTGFTIPEVSYSPEVVFLHNNSDRNTINHSGRLQLNKVLPKTSLSLDHTSASREDIFAEAATRARQETHATTLEVRYELGGKTQLESMTSQNMRDSSVNLASKEWREDLWFNYEWLPKVTLAFGASGGYAEVTPGRDSVLQADQLRLTYFPTAKLTFMLRGGVEWRSFHGQGGRDALGAIAGFTADYQVLDATTLSFTADRQPRSSNYAQDQLATSTSVALNLEQNFGPRYFGTVTGGYSFVENAPASQNVQSLSSYDFYTAKIQFGYAITKRARAGAFFRRLTRGAGGGLEQFAANEVGLNLTYHF